MVNVLMPHVASHAAARAAEMLREAGHEVHSCHNVGDSGFACVALRERPCPLEDVDIDVALDVRSRQVPFPGPDEDGVVCAIRRHVPLVVAGEAGANPFEAWTSAVADRSEVVARVEEVALLPLPVESARATEAVRQALARRGFQDAPADVSVFRRGRRLQVVAQVGGDLDPSIRSAVAVAAASGVNAVDHFRQGLDVDVVAAAPPG